MNVTELSRRLNIPPRDLKALLQEFGFGVGHRAIKVDKRIAERILKQSRELQAAYDAKRKRAQEALKIIVPDSVPTEIAIPAEVTVKEFALTLQVPVTKLLGELMKNGIIATLNDHIDVETATVIAEDLGRTVRVVDHVAAIADADHATVPTADATTLTEIRPPTVVIMGHVDHGKTTLLDTIRKSNVIASEAGGITQHIGAYQVVRNGQRITFIDTPGHEAFTTMRSRGAKIADIAILVVAADDGVQPQTKEALNIIQGSGLPFVVAMNKIDRAEANPEKVKNELSELGVISEEWGGKTAIVPISARAGTGVEQLLDMVLLTADLDKDSRKTRTDTEAVATVIESHIDPGSGPLATVLVQLGTLHVGDTLGIRGFAYGKVRALKDWNNAILADAPSGTPVVIVGLKAAPEVGDIVRVHDPKTLTKLKAMGQIQKDATSATEKRAKRKKSDVHLPIILRADVVGSLEAITLSLEKISQSDASVSIIGKGLGAITEHDVLHADAGGARIYGFHSEVTQGAQQLAREKGVVIMTTKIIYELIDDARAALEAQLMPEQITIALGQMQVLKVFRLEPQSVVIGGKVLQGVITPDIAVRILRKGEPMGEGTVKEIRVGKEIVLRVEEGQEAGLKIVGYTDIHEHDVLEFSRDEERKRTLTSPS